MFLWVKLSIILVEKRSNKWLFDMMKRKEKVQWTEVFCCCYFLKTQSFCFTYLCIHVSPRVLWQQFLGVVFIGWHPWQMWFILVYSKMPIESLFIFTLPCGHCLYHDHLGFIKIWNWTVPQSLFCLMTSPPRCKYCGESTSQWVRRPAILGWLCLSKMGRLLKPYAIHPGPPYSHLPTEKLCIWKFI